MGFQSARKDFNDLFTTINDDVNTMLTDAWATGKYIPVAEIKKRTDELIDEHNMDSVVYDTSWDTIFGKAKPVIPDSEVGAEQTHAEWLLLFLLGWNSFGKLLPNRIKNTTRIIRREYEKNTKRIYRDVFRATRDQNIDAKIYGEQLSPSVKRRYKQIWDQDRRRASEYLNEQFGRKAGRVADRRNRKTPNHFANRMTETESLTIRMDLALKKAGESGKIKYISISVKPKACSICQSFVGNKYPLGQQPHLLAHPSCRCDYIIHYVGGQVLLIPGSGRVDLIT